MRVKENEIIGHRFTRLTVIKALGKKGHSFVWLAKCDCGNNTIVDYHSLKRRNTQSCGCLRRENRIRMNTVHGLSKHPAFSVYYDMLDRCYNPRNAGYHNYGGRGIIVCEQWKERPRSFLNWAEQFFVDGKIPKDLTLDRINNNGAYSAENCRWTTRKEQANNRRTNRLLTFNGRTQTIAQWQTELGLGNNVIRKRLKLGWSIEKTLSNEK